ncbi:hypothetical protein ACA910_004195 [Epithemia clementina (nom. ined.)]
MTRSVGRCCERLLWRGSNLVVEIIVSFVYVSNIATIGAATGFPGGSTSNSAANDSSLYHFRQNQQSLLHIKSKIPDSTMTSTSLKTTSAPVALREEDRVLYAGVAPEGWDVKKFPRQSASSKEPLLDPPRAVPDPYGWMRDETRANPVVLSHLEAENAFTNALTQHLEPLRETLYQEMITSIEETDYRTPYADGSFYYYSRTMKGKSYTVHCRAPRSADDSSIFPIQWDGTAESPILPGEQVTLDINELAVNKSYCSIGSIRASPSHNLLAYTADYTGGETCLMYVKDLTTGEIVHHDPNLEMYGSVAWGADDSTLFYFKMDDSHRPFRLYRRDLKSHGISEGKEDQLLLEEPDPLFWMGMYKSTDDRYLFVESSSKESTEIFFLDLKDPQSTLQCVARRRSQVLYEIDHRDGKWWIQSNVGGLPNMALFLSPAVANCESQWKLVTDKSKKPLFSGGFSRSLDYATCFTDHVVASGREGGLPRVWILSIGSNNVVNDFQLLSFTEDAYDVGLGVNREFDTNRLVLIYDSMVTPTQSLEINMDDPSHRRILKEKIVEGYDKSLYGSERTTALSRDGKTEIPVTLLYRKEVMKKHKELGIPQYVHLYGYGSYGSCKEASFHVTRLSLLNRGIVYVLAHVRGGGEMGRQWYEQPNGAKYLCKKNTFNDFIDVARWLIEKRSLTVPKMLSCEGRSAGGLLIGASINQAPELFKVALLSVPFVDVVPTMIDASLPLTTVEWEEWGNPNEAKYFDYMMEYSPVQNVVPGATYPSCLITGGLHDPRVPYWEPAKLAAAIRHYHNPETSGPVCLKMEMSAGHSGSSDRYKYLRELSFDYAFLLDQLGLAEQSASN